MRYLIATSIAGTSALALGAAAIVSVLTERLSLWSGDWWWGYNNLLQSIAFLMVLVALSVGWQAGSRASGLTNLLERGPISAFRAIRGVAAIPLWGSMILYLVGVAWVGAITITHDGVVDDKAALILAGHLSMVLLSGAIGLAVGAVTPTPYAAPIAGGLAAALLFVVPPGGRNMFSLTGAMAPVIGAAPSAKYHAIVLLACSLASASLYWLVVRRVKTGPTGAVAGTLAVLALCAGSYALPEDTFGFTGDGPTRCTQATVQVCVYPGYDRILSPAAKQISELEELATQHGVTLDVLPTKFRQFGGSRPSVGVGTLALSDEARRNNRLTSTDLATSLVDPVWCEAMFADSPPLALLRKRDRVLDWMIWIQGDLTPNELRARHKELADSPRSQWGMIVTADLRDLRECAN